MKQVVLRNCPTIVFEGEAKGEVCPKVAMFGLQMGCSSIGKRLLHILEETLFMNHLLEFVIYIKLLNFLFVLNRNYKNSLLFPVVK